jgi:hypothetical protein
MKKKTEIPSNNSKKGHEIRQAQRPQTNTREDIKTKTTDSYNTNNGPKQRSRKKAI